MTDLLENRVRRALSVVARDTNAALSQPPPLPEVPLTSGGSSGYRRRYLATAAVVVLLAGLASAALTWRRDDGARAVRTTRRPTTTVHVAISTPRPPLPLRPGERVLADARRLGGDGYALIATGRGLGSCLTVVEVTDGRRREVTHPYKMTNAQCVDILVGLGWSGPLPPPGRPLQSIGLWGRRSKNGVSLFGAVEDPIVSFEIKPTGGRSTGIRPAISDAGQRKVRWIFAVLTDTAGRAGTIVLRDAAGKVVRQVQYRTR